MNYKVIPNFLLKDEHELISNYISNLDFYYQKRVANIEDTSSFFFSNCLYDIRKSKLNFEYFKIIVPLLYNAKIQIPWRIQVNCFIKQSKPIFTQPHVDNDNPHNVLLYSVNTNNGYTILDPKGKNIKVPSVANQALFFDGSIEHQAVTQTDENVRFNINVNFPA